MVSPQCSHPDRLDSNELLASVFPGVATLCGPVVNEATFARTLFQLFNAALSSLSPEDRFEPLAQRQDQASCASEPIRMGLVLGLSEPTSVLFEERLSAACGG